MVYEFKRPNKDNVEIGDLLVVEGGMNLHTYPIEKVGNDIVVSSVTGGLSSTYYKRAIVLKKDGSYLVGEHVTKFIVSQTEVQE